MSENQPRGSIINRAELDEALKEEREKREALEERVRQLEMELSNLRRDIVRGQVGLP